MIRGGKGRYLRKEDRRVISHTLVDRLPGTVAYEKRVVAEVHLELLVGIRATPRVQT